jgi:hypothetical protein
MNRSYPGKIAFRSIGFVFATLAAASFAQTPLPALDERVVIQLEVRPFAENRQRGLERKRFYLIKGTRQQHQQLIEDFAKRPLLTRDCYYRSVNASEALISWLKENDCESVYCREIDYKYLEGADAITEFRLAYAKGVSEYGSEKLARLWLPVNLPDNIRSGFYKQRQEELKLLLQNAEAASGAQVLSVMTDRSGNAYFTDVEPGSYILSNIIPTKIGSSFQLWTCDVQVKSDEVGTKTVFRMSRINKKCTPVDKEMPACPVTQTAGLHANTHAN